MCPRDSMSAPRDSLAGVKQKPVDAVIATELLGSPWVQRLHRISFLGTLDEHPDCVAPSSRLEHSLGVTKLAIHAAKGLGIEGQPLRELAAAALLHDIGHFPLSHAAEQGFERATGAGHHEVSRWIILGEQEIPRSASLCPTLERCRLDPELIWKIIAGESGEMSILVCGLFSVDTLDGIPRAARTFRVPGVKIPPNLFVRSNGALAIPSRQLSFFDRFWRLKDRVYSSVINRPSNIIYEAELTDRVARAVSPAIFKNFVEFDDAALRVELELIRRPAAAFRRDDRSFALVRNAKDGIARRKMKRYAVDNSIRPSGGVLTVDRWSKRYRHFREELALAPVKKTSQASFQGWGAGTEGPEI